MLCHTILVNATIIFTVLADASFQCFSRWSLIFSFIRRELDWISRTMLASQFGRCAKHKLVCRPLADDLIRCPFCWSLSLFEISSLQPTNRLCEIWKLFVRLWCADLMVAAASWQWRRHLLLFTRQTTIGAEFIVSQSINSKQETLDWRCAMTTRTKSKTQAKSDASAKPTTQKYFDTKVFFLDGESANWINKRSITLLG